MSCSDKSFRLLLLKIIFSKFKKQAAAANNSVRAVDVLICNCLRFAGRAVCRFKNQQMRIILILDVNLYGMFLIEYDSEFITVITNNYMPDAMFAVAASLLSIHVSPVLLNCFLCCIIWNIRDVNVYVVSGGYQYDVCLSNSWTSWSQRYLKTSTRVTSNQQVTILTYFSVSSSFRQIMFDRWPPSLD